MLFRRHCEGHPGTDLVQVIGELREVMDERAFIEAWQETVARHDSLHCRFIEDNDGQPCQIPAPDFQLPVMVMDWNGLSGDEEEAALNSYLHEDRMRGFDFSAPPLRLALMHTGGHHLRFCLTIHHMVFDGSGLQLILEEVFARLRGCPPEGPAPSYRDYIAWHQAQDWSSAGEFWKAFLGGYHTPVSFPIAGIKPPSDPIRYTSGSVNRPVRDGITARLRDLARSSGVTLNTILQAAWALLLARHNGADDVVFGTTRRCRKSNVPGAELTPGMFVNTVPMRVHIPEGGTLRDWFREIRADWNKIREYENTPLVLVQGWSEIPKGSRLFGSILNFLDPYWSLEFKARGGEWEHRDFCARGQGGDYIAMEVHAGGPELILRLPFAQDWLDEPAARVLTDQFEAVLERFTFDSGQSPRNIRLEREDGESGLVARVESKDEFPHLRESLPALFQKQVARAPSAIALVRKGKPVTYLELDERSNRLAHSLAAAGLAPGMVAGICMERSAQWVIAMLAVLKCGAGVLPLDTEYPAARIALLLGGCDAAVSLTKSKHLHLFPAGASVINLDLEKESLRAHAKTSPPAVAGGDALAWIFHTSGSTGEPKAVLVPHRAIVRLVLENPYADFSPDETYLLFSPVSFDAVTFEIWSPLLNGGRLVVFPPGLPSLAKFGDFIGAEGVTTLWMTTGLFAEMIRHWPEKLRGVRQILTGGSVMPLAAAARALAMLPGCRIINCYGPTENATFTTTHEITARDLARSSIPIGKPIRRTYVRVLDEQGLPCAVGVPGEIHCGGDGLALRYKRDPELTARRYIPDPYSPDPAARLYRTGDLGRWLPDGSLEFVGRSDDQVKIRGFRVEPGEVEAWLCRHPGVIRGAVVVRKDEDGMPALHAYFEPASEEADNPTAYLRENLPTHLLPATVNCVATMPLKPNGKIDTAALPEPSRRKMREFEAAATPLQQVVRGIFARVLDRPSLGMSDDFFDCGGHSLKVMQLLALLERTFGREIPVRTIFAASTPGQMADWLEKSCRQATRAGELIIPILPAGSRPAIFVLPGGQGRDDEMIVIAGLSRYLPEGFPMMAFHAGRAESEGWSSVPDIAARYLDALLEFHGNRPFILVGECLAGVIAHEMARLCRERGLALVSLILLDALCPGVLSEPSTAESLPVGPSSPTRAYLDTLMRFRPGAYIGEIHLIVTKESRGLDPTLGWRDGEHGRLHLVEVPGNHDSYIREEAAGTGAALADILAMIDTRAVFPAKEKVLA